MFAYVSVLQHLLLFLTSSLPIFYSPLPLCSLLLLPFISVFFLLHSFFSSVLTLPSNSVLFSVTFFSSYYLLPPWAFTALLPHAPHLISYTFFYLFLLPAFFSFLWCQNFIYYVDSLFVDFFALNNKPF